VHVCRGTAWNCVKTTPTYQWRALTLFLLTSDEDASRKRFGNRGRECPSCVFCSRRFWHLHCYYLCRACILSVSLRQFRKNTQLILKSRITFTMCVQCMRM